MKQQEAERAVLAEVEGLLKDLARYKGDERTISGRVEFYRDQFESDAQLSACLEIIAGRMR